MRNSITIAIADRNPMTACLLTDHFKRHPEFAVVSSSADKSSLLRSVRQHKPAIAIVNADLHDGPLSGLAAVREVHMAEPQLRPILLYEKAEPNLMVEGARAGARGFFSRHNFQFSSLRKCVRRVSEGQIWIGNAELENIFDALTFAPPLKVSQTPNALSNREQEVIQLVAEGLGNREIADHLNLSEHTVKNYLFHIFEKLGISNRVELVLYAVSNPTVNALPESQFKQNRISKRVETRPAIRYARSGARE
jgi:DNA-binding NarL/FixJ family response regulator